MSFLWFLVAMIFFVLWLRARPGRDRDKTTSEYDQGYWDGYRAFGDQAKELLTAKRVDASRLQKLINEGEGVSETQPIQNTAPREEMLGVIAEDVDYLEDIKSSQTTPAAAGQQEVVFNEYEADEPESREAAFGSQQHELSAKELAEEKERVTLRNLNTMLYMGSFLLVAAAAAFIAAAMPELVRLFGLIFVVVLFYVIGVVLHIRVPRLRPAAVAFVGTGLAILPFVGVALTLLGGMGVVMAWLLISVVGLVAYGYASVVLQSQAVSYLTMAFVLSLASSAVATASLPIMWYFIVLIGVSLIAASVSFLWQTRMPEVFRKPIETTGQVVTPIALVASIFAARDMPLYMYEIVFGIGTAHYLVVWLQQRQLVYESAARVLAHVTLALVGWDIFVTTANADNAAFGIWWCGLWVAQFAYSVLRIRQSNSLSYQAETTWFILAQIGVVITPLFWMLSPHSSLFTMCSLLILGGVSLVAAVKLRKPGWGYVGLVASWITPLYVGRIVAEPELPWSVIIGSYTMLAVVSLAGMKWLYDQGRSLSLKNFFVGAIFAYSAGIALSGVAANDLWTLGWALLLAGVVLVGHSYVARLRETEIVGAVLVTLATASWVYASPIAVEWRGLVSVVLAGTLLGLATIAHQILADDTRRRNTLLIMTVIYGALIWLVTLNTHGAVEQTGVVLLLVATVGGFGLRVLCQRRNSSSQLQTILQASYLSYLILAWLLVFSVHALGWHVLIYTVVAFVLWAAAHVERHVFMTIVGNITAFIGIYTLWQWRDFSASWEVFGVMWSVAAIYYLLYWLYIDTRDVRRQWVQVLSTWLLLIVAVVAGGANDTAHTVVAIATLVGSGLLLIAHGRVVTQAKQTWLRATAGAASVVYVVTALAVGVESVGLAGWAFATAAVYATWYSYLARKVSAEAIGGVFGVAAIALWLSLAPLGVWHETVVVTVSAGVLMVACWLHHSRGGETSRRDVMLRLGAVVFAGFGLAGFSSSEVVQQTGALALVAGTMLAYGARRVHNVQPRDVLSRIFTASYVAYLVLAWLLTLQLALGWQVAVCALATIVVWTASHVERVKALVVAGQLLLVVTLVHLWHLLELDANWIVFGVAGIGASAAYIAYWLYAARSDEWRRIASLAVATGVLVGGTIIGLGYSDTERSIAAAILFIAAAGMVGIHGYLTRKLTFAEVAVYAATLGLQRIVGLLVPEFNFVFYAHWWAITIAIVAFWRAEYVGRRLALAMAWISISTGLSALSDGGYYQLLFLVEHIVLLVAGALLRKQWAVWWGIVASVMAVLYFIKDYAFLWLALLGILLISLVVWRLTKVAKT